MAERAEHDSTSSKIESFVPRTTQDVMKMSGNDELKFGVLIGLVEVGQLSNKDVVDTVLSLVCLSLIQQLTCCMHLFICDLCFMLPEK